MKKVLSELFVVILSVTLVLAGCGKKDDNKPSTLLTVGELWAKVNEIAGYGAMTAVPKSDYSDVYGIDASKIEDSVWYMSENPSLNADETAIFKVSDASYAETLAELFRGRIDRQKKVAEAYSPDEAAKLERAEVVVAGNYVYYCVGTANTAVTNLLKTLIK